MNFDFCNAPWQFTQQSFKFVLLWYPVKSHYQQIIKNTIQKQLNIYQMQLWGDVYLLEQNQQVKYLQLMHRFFSKVFLILNPITIWIKSVNGLSNGRCYLMLFNVDLSKQDIETCFCHKSHKKIYNSLIFNDTNVQLVTSQKHLGLILDSKLDFNEHIDNKINKCNKIIVIMKRLSLILSGKVNSCKNQSVLEFIFSILH